MAEAPISIMQRLKESTNDLHRLTESRPLQRQIARGTVTSDAFAAYLGQLHLVHRALETALERARARHPAVAEVAGDDRRRLPQLERDLRFWGVEPASTAPGRATARFVRAVEQLEDVDPVALLGPLYVLEGSTNGGRFLARVLREAWQLDGAGLESLDPYGDRQAECWAAFKRDMDGAALTADERDSVVAAARDTFAAIADLSDEVADVAGPS